MATKQDRITSLEYLICKYHERALTKLHSTPDIIEAYEQYDEFMTEATYYENLLKKENK